MKDILEQFKDMPGGEAAYYREWLTRQQIEREHKAIKKFARLGEITRLNMIRLYGSWYQAALEVFAR